MFIAGQIFGALSKSPAGRPAGRERELYLATVCCACIADVYFWTMESSLVGLLTPAVDISANQILEFQQNFSCSLTCPNQPGKRQI